MATQERLSPRSCFHAMVFINTIFNTTTTEDRCLLSHPNQVLENEFPVQKRSKKTAHS